MNIGDIWFGFRGGDAGLQVDAKKSGAAAGATAGKSFQSKLGESFKSGLGIGAGLGAFQLLSQGIGMATSAIGDWTRAAAADESSQVKLRTSLEANVKGWDGNTDAIEKVLASRMKLGFSDDEQRESLSLLVAKTGDVTKALNIQRAAMDLARLKGIGLAEASKAIALGMGGSGRALKELGINVKDYANETEILAAIQSKAAGQAEKFGETTEGAWVEANVAMDEASEIIGYKLTPLIKDMAVFVRDNAVPAVEALADVMGDLFDANSPDRRSAEDWSWPFGPKDTPVVDIGPFKDVLGGYSEGKDAAEAMAASASETAYIYDQRGQRIKGTAKGVAAAVGLVGWSAERAARKVGMSADDITDYWNDLRDTLSGLGGEAADAIYDPIIAASDYAATKREIAETRATIASKNSTKEQVRDAKVRLVELQKTAFEQQVALIGYGKMNAGEQKKFLDDLRTKWATATGEAKADIAALIAYIEKLSANVNIKVTYARPGRAPVALARGGPVSAGTLYRVNELDTEYFRPAVNGAVLTPLQAAQSGGATGGSGHTITIYNPEPRAAEADIGRVLRRTAAMGMR